MRTMILLGLATGSLILAGRASSAELPMAAAQPVALINPSSSYLQDPLDYHVPVPADARVYTGYPDRIPSEVDYRSGDGSDGYDSEGRWTGTWNGTYETPEGRQYHGTYEGTYEGRAGTAYPPPPYANGPQGAPPPGYYQNGYDPRYAADMDRRCGRGGGTAGGAVIGGLIGGIAGNRIAGHGNRTGGTLIGAGAGALAGAAIGNASDRKACDDYYARRDSYAQGGGYYQDGGYYGAGGTRVYQQGGYGYGYYSPGVVVTTIINGAPIVTETVETTTTTRYVNVPVRKRYIAKKRISRPKARPRCAC